MIYWQLLWVYLKIGMFGFGGGYAMLSLIQHEIVDLHHWLTPQQFTDVVAISQMTPGPIGYLRRLCGNTKCLGSCVGHCSRLLAFFYFGVAHFLFLCEV
ncbi:Chromate transport protein [Bacteroides ovatus]|nr:chromate transporter [Bacteroides ovatus]CAG9929091.1 Chromate transport protein [Bacteroides ovatus]